MQDFGKELGQFGEVGVDGRITLTWILKKYDEMSWTGLKVARYCEVFALLGCYEALIGSCRRFGTAYQSHIHEKQSKEDFSWTAVPKRR